MLTKYMKTTTTTCLLQKANLCESNIDNKNVFEKTNIEMALNVNYSVKSMKCV